MPCSRLSAGGPLRWYFHGCGLLLYCPCKGFAGSAGSAKTMENTSALWPRSVCESGHDRQQAPSLSRSGPDPALQLPKYPRVRPSVPGRLGPTASRFAPKAKGANGRQRETSAPRQSLLGLKRCRPSVFDNWWWIPLAGQCLRFRCIEAHGEVEGSLWSRQPVTFQIATRRLVLKIDVE
jgi:hypothetical protein